MRAHLLFVGLLLIVAGITPDGPIGANTAPVPTICVHAANVPLPALPCKLDTTKTVPPCDGTPVNVPRCGLPVIAYKCGTSIGNGVLVSDGATPGYCTTTLQPSLCTVAQNGVNIGTARWTATCPVPIGIACGACGLQPLPPRQILCIDCTP